MTKHEAPSTFAGLPISGDVSYYAEPREKRQKTAEEFKAALDVLFAVDGVKAVVWTQYTPYFNDGDPCTFGINFTGVVVDPAPSGATSYETVDDEAGNEVPVFDTYDIRNAPGAEALARLMKNMEGDLDSYEDVFLKAFGDPARVIARPGGFTVEHYSHD